MIPGTGSMNENNKQCEGELSIQLVGESKWATYATRGVLGQIEMEAYY